MKQKTKSKNKITAKEIADNIGFLKTKGKLMNVLAASREVSCHASVRWHPGTGFRLSPE